MKQLHPLTLESRPLISDFLHRYPPQISELTFTNLFAWRHSRPVWFTEFRDSLLFVIEGSCGRVLFGNPVGPVSLAEVLEEYGDRLVGVDRFPADRLLDLPAGCGYSADVDNADYVYRSEALAWLAGRQLAKKRNLINQCLSTYDCRYEAIGPELLDECRDLQKRWCRERGCISEAGLHGEDRAIGEMLDHFEAFGLIGGAIRINGRLEAFSLGEALNPETAVCHVEKAMPGYKGLAQLINQWFVRFGLKGFRFINREQDLGIPGLRAAKESYLPDHMVEKVRISFPVSLPPAAGPVPPGCLEPGGSGSPP